MGRSSSLTVIVRIFSTLAFAVPENTLAKSVFLDCGVIEFRVKKETSIEKTLHYMIDFDTKEISEFSEYFGKYFEKCTDRFSDSQSHCSFGNDLLNFARAETIMGVMTSVNEMTFLRASGRITGSYKMYDGNVLNFEKRIKAEPTIYNQINGFCKKGQDMSLSEKAF